jgi:maltooligosyltrehalose trehalohydrolase
LTYGATPLGGQGVEFRVWAPKPQSLAVKLLRANGGVHQMTRIDEDFHVLVENARPGDRYFLVIDGVAERPDPVSRSQPEGVHGPSEIIDPARFSWTDQNWKGIALSDYIFYELHTGTFTGQGDFESIVTKLPYLTDLGVTAVELMPVVEFPGARNWGYDGVDLYAPHSAYGGPNGLKSLVNAAHGAGLAVVLDVVYNHLGPEGNYLAEFGPYFTDQYRTPWGQSINFDGPGSDGVRRFFIDNALYWLNEYHIDALRLDAIHGIFDLSAFHILSELRDRFHQEAARLGRRAFIIAESDQNDVRTIQPRSRGGNGLDAQWHDEFHHSLISVLTPARRGYMAGFGNLRQVEKALTDGFVFDGIYSSYRKRRFGSSSKNEPGERFVAFIQNHDQVANTAQGFRLSELTSIERCKLAAMLLLCSPYLPLLFMGEEYADPAPFLYFTSHGEPGLARAVTEGRRKEFADFAGSTPVPDPQAEETFGISKLTWAFDEPGPHAEMLRFYRDLIALRKRWPCLRNCRKDLTHVTVDEQSRWLRMERGDPSGCRALVLCNFRSEPAIFHLDAESNWRLALSTGPVSSAPHSVTIRGYNAAVYLSGSNTS